MGLRMFAGNLRGKFSKFVAEVGVDNLFLLLLLAVITIYPLLFVGYTTNDDADIAINYGNTTNLIETARLMAIRQGRFTFFWGYPLLRLPYIIDNQVWYLTVKFGSFFLSLSALYYAVSQIFKSSWIALLSLLFFLAFIQNGWDHNALTSYPFAFIFYAVLLLVSLGLFSTAIDRNNLQIAGLSAVLYFFALGTELFVLFFPLYVAVLLTRGAPDETVIRRLLAGKKYILAVALALMVYLVIYLVWRCIHPSEYDGNSLNGFNLLAAGKVVAAYSLNAFPFASMKFILSHAQQMLFTNSAGLSNILYELNASDFIKPAVAGFLFARLMTTEHFIVPQERIIFFGAILTCVGIFLPNLLLGFVLKHQGWVASGSYSYLYTYYSFISAAVFSSLILAYINTKSRLWHPILRQTFILLGIIVIVVLGFAVEVRNKYIAFDQKLSHRRWQLMDEVIKSPTFMEIQDGSSVVAPTLSEHQRGIAVVPADYWSKYIKYKTGKNVQFVNNACKSGAPCFSLVFRQELHSDNQFIVLAPTKYPDSLLSSELTIYSMPIDTNAVLVGSFVHDNVSQKIMINDEPVTNVGYGLFSSDLPSVSDDKLVQTSKVIGNVDIFPERITISHYSVEPRLLSLSTELAEGISVEQRLLSLSAELAKGINFKKKDYPDFLAEVSGMSGYEAWGRWTDAAIGPVAKFRFKQALPRKFTLEITAYAFGPNYGSPVKVRVGTVEKTFIITPPKKDIETYRLTFETDGTVDTLGITPPKPTSPNDITKDSRDSRKLGVALISLKIIQGS